MLLFLSEVQQWYIYLFIFWFNLSAVFVNTCNLYMLLLFDSVNKAFVVLTLCSACFFVIIIISKFVWNRRQQSIAIKMLTNISRL